MRTHWVAAALLALAAMAASAPLRAEDSKAGGQKTDAQGAEGSPKADQAVKPAEAAPAEPEPEDYVRTKAGVEFRGKITEETAEQVTIRTKSGPVTIPRIIILELRKGGVDYRSASERIASVAVPEGQAAAYLEKAKAAFEKNKLEETVALCKGLMATKAGALTGPERESVGKMAAGALFVLKDWKAAAEALRYASRGMENDTDRQRVLAAADALAENAPPTIAGQTAENFMQAFQLAMNWKADKIFGDVKSLARGH